MPETPRKPANGLGRCPAHRAPPMGAARPWPRCPYRQRGHGCADRGPEACRHHRQRRILPVRRICRAKIIPDSIRHRLPSDVLTSISRFRRCKRRGGSSATAQRRCPSGIVVRSSCQVCKQMLRRTEGGVLRRPHRSQSGTEPYRRRLWHFRVGKEGEEQEEAGGRILDTFGPRGRTVGKADQFIPHQPGPRQLFFPAGDLPGVAPARMSEEVVNAVVADQIAVDHYSSGTVFSRYPEHRPAFGIEEDLGQGVGIGAVIAEPLRNGTCGTSPVAAHHEVVRPEARTGRQ